MSTATRNARRAAALRAIASSDHAYIGIRPADATPAESPCIILDGTGSTDLDSAEAAAGNEWPDAKQWSLIASDEALIRKDPTWPPRMRALRAPITLTTYPA